ncbi:MAG TPA: beta-ketoacyl-[acyl-carrier-protein] synthase II, partial [Ktedonobacter sp.]|nr:beta-ketoacyl-[acyl-carrier-protein] synthase II [Ktedonobacter sp.]
MTAKVVITGMGVISPYGVGPAVLWDKLMAGETGLKALTSFDTSHIQCKVGGQFSEFRPESYISPRIIRKVDRFSALGLISAQQALQDAG